LTNREEFLNHIAARLRRPRVTDKPEQPVRGTPSFWGNYELSSSDRTAKFEEELAKLGVKAHRFSSSEALSAGLEQLLTQLSPRSVVSWARESFHSFAVDSVLDRFDAVAMERDESMTVMEQANVGITTVETAIADTGTIVVYAKPGQSRLVSLLPTVHIALVRASQIVTRLGEAIVRLEQEYGEFPPSAVYFISGPSRSSDIENDLTIGVHGPAEVHVLIWDDVVL